MATTVRIHLEGGPCAGQNAAVKRTGDLLPGYTCKGTNYQPTERSTPAGRVVYTTAASQKPPPTSGSEDGVKRAKALGSWHHMTRRVFSDAPKELRHTEKARAEIRGLRHRHGLR